MGKLRKAAAHILKGLGQLRPVKPKRRNPRKRARDIVLRNVELLPPDEDELTVTAALSGDTDQIERTKHSLYAIVSAFRTAKGIDVRVVDTAFIFKMHFNNPCAAEFARDFINYRIVK